MHFGMMGPNKQQRVNLAAIKPYLAPVSTLSDLCRPSTRVAWFSHVSLSSDFVGQTDVSRVEPRFRSPQKQKEAGSIPM